jgi:hypothetical protein
MLAGAWPLYLATDADRSGDRSAATWPDYVRRVRPPAGKYWTDAYQMGIDLRRWWIEEALPLDGPFATEERAAIQE